MRIEDRLRRDLAARASAIVLAQPEWDRIATRLGPKRPARRRWYLAGALGAAAVAAALAALVVAQGPDPSNNLQVSSGGQNRPSTPTPPSTMSGASGAGIGPPDGPLPPGFQPASLTWISETEGWALGTAPCTRPPCTALVRTRDGGVTWNGVPLPVVDLATEGAGESGVARVRFADAADGWLLGPELWATHDGGSTWRRLEVGGPVTSLEVAGRTAYAVVASPGGGPARLAASPEGADRWDRLGPDLDASMPLVAGGATLYAQGVDGRLVAASPEGVSVRARPCPTPGWRLAARSEAYLVAVCATDAGAGSSTKRVLTSGDGGRTWTSAGEAPRAGQTNAVAATVPETVVVAASGGDSRLYRSGDGGRSWTTVFLDSAQGGAPFVDLRFTTPLRATVILAGATQRMLLTSADGGVTWAPARFQA